MSRKTISTILVALLAIGALAPQGVRGDIVCPDSSYATVQFTRTFTGHYRNGEPYDVVTIGPGGVESFADAGIIIRVYLRNCQGAPLPGVPPQEVVLFNSMLCLCPGGNIADAPTDANGCTSFSGALSGGGYATSLLVFADGIQIGSLPVTVNSPEVHDCYLDIDDFAAWAQYYGAESGVQASYSVRWDWNEDGFIDLSDLAFLSRFYLRSCTTPAAPPLSGRQP